MVATNKIVIVVTGDPPDPVRQDHGDYARMMAAAVGDAWHGEYHLADARAGLGAADGEAAAVIITGSSANVHTRESWIVRTEEWLRTIHQRGTPVLGVCFGHQLLAQALGGDVQPHPRGRELSTVSVERLSDDPLFDGLPRAFTANACHSDTVLVRPADATVLARNDHDPHQALRFGTRCYGVQFHPEFDQQIMRDFVDDRAGSLLDEGRDPAAYRARAADTPSSRKIMSNFVQHVVQAP